jgi:predicted esterase
VPITNTVYIFHGRDSSPQGRKIKALRAIARDCGWKVVVPDFRRVKDPDKRVEKFLEKQKRPAGKVLIAGSSMGGYVAIEVSRQFQPDGLFLLAPAIYIEGYGQMNPEPDADQVTVIHGWDDNLIDPARAIRFADKFKTDLHLLNDGHELYNSIPFIEQTFRTLLESMSGSTRLERIVPTL